MIRVVITGLGFVSSLGLDMKSTWAAMVAGKTGIGPFRHFKANREPIQIAGEVDLPADTVAPRHASRSEILAMLALEDALRQSDPDISWGDPRRRGIFQGVATTGLPAGEEYILARMTGRSGTPTKPVYQHPCTITDRLAERLNAMGPCCNTMNACSSSLMAIGQAWERIACGELDLALAGGSEALCQITFGGFSCLRAMDPEPCRPFSVDRTGMNLGEGAAHLVLEPLHLAKLRGANIIGEVLGFGASLDAHHPTAPHPEGEGAARAMNMALRVARLYPEEVDLVSAHGTATPANDGAEMLAIQRTLGDAARKVSVTSTKSQFGHTLGAAGAMGTAAAVLALRDQVVSPTLRLEHPDPICDLDCTPKEARQRPIRAALVNAFAFGGNNVCLALRKWGGR